MLFGLFGSRAKAGVVFSQNPKAEAALKRATALKKKGRMDEAIAALRDFRRHAERGEASFGIESYVRLPLYLQAAGRREEAWEEFYRLVNKGYPHQLDDEGCRCKERSTVYDKMRLFLQRDGHKRLAVYFDVMCLASRLRGMSLHGEHEQLVQCLGNEWLSQRLSPALVKGGLPQDLPKMVDLIQSLPDKGFDLGSFSSQLASVTGAAESHGG